jgi:hypothetical protein
VRFGSRKGRSLGARAPAVTLVKQSAALSHARIFMRPFSVSVSGNGEPTSVTTLHVATAEWNATHSDTSNDALSPVVMLLGAHRCIEL